MKVDLSGQSLELWPPELLVDEHLARAAIEKFIATRTVHSALHWIRIDRFPRIYLSYDTDR